MFRSCYSPYIFWSLYVFIAIFRASFDSLIIKLELGMGESKKESKKSELPRNRFQERHVVNKGDFFASNKSEKNLHDLARNENHGED